MIVLRDGKLVDTPLRDAEVEIAGGISEAVTDFTGVKEVQISEDRRYGLVADPANMLIRQVPKPDGTIVFRALDAGGVPIGPERPLFIVARSDARDYGAEQTALGLQVFSQKPAVPITDGSEAIPEGGGVLGRHPPTLMPGPKPYARSYD